MKMMARYADDYAIYTEFEKPSLQDAFMAGFVLARSKAAEKAAQEVRESRRTDLFAIISNLGEEQDTPSVQDVQELKRVIANCKKEIALLQDSWHKANKLEEEVENMRVGKKELMQTHKATCVERDKTRDDLESVLGIFSRYYGHDAVKILLDKEIK